MSTEESTLIVEGLRKIRVDGVQTYVEPVREHRFVFVLRGNGLSDAVSDTDPQKEGAEPLLARATSAEGEATATLVAKWVEGAKRYLANPSTGSGLANMALLRGFAKRPNWPAMPDVFKLRAAAVAHYPMYRGLAKLAGMEALPVGPTLDDSVATLRENWGRFDFFFVHYKYTDTAGEDGDFDRKVAKFEEADTAIKPLMEMEPDVLMIAGDHSTPATMAAHSWHPVPFILRSKDIRADECGMFSETELQKGSLGTFPAKEALPLAMAHAGRLKKYGA